MKSIQGAYNRFSNNQQSSGNNDWLNEFQELKTTKDSARENALFAKLKADLEKSSGGNKTLVHASELEGAGFYHPSHTGGSMYSIIETERAYRAKDPNSAEFKQRNIEAQNKSKEDEYKASLRVAQNKAARPWLFGG